MFWGVVSVLREMWGVVRTGGRGGSIYRSERAVLRMGLGDGLVRCECQWESLDVETTEE